MNKKALQALYYSLNSYEMSLLKQSKENFEQNTKIQFINTQAYLDYLATAVTRRQNKGEFVPRNIEEAQAGQYL